MTRLINSCTYLRFVGISWGFSPRTSVFSAKAPDSLYFRAHPPTQDAIVTSHQDTQLEIIELNIKNKESNQQKSPASSCRPKFASWLVGTWERFAPWIIFRRIKHTKRQARRSLSPVGCKGIPPPNPLN